MSDEDNPRDGNDAATEELPPPVSRHIMPFGPRVLVRLIKGSDRSATGLYLPPGAKDAQAEVSYGEVLEVARAGVDADDLGQNVSGVPQGAKVLFEKNVGLVVPWDDNLRLVHTKDIVALVEEIDLRAAH